MRGRAKLGGLGRGGDENPVMEELDGAKAAGGVLDIRPLYPGVPAEGEDGGKADGTDADDEGGFHGVGQRGIPQSCGQMRRNRLEQCMAEEL